MHNLEAGRDWYRGYQHHAPNSSSLVHNLVLCSRRREHLPLTGLALTRRGNKWTAATRSNAGARELSKTRECWVPTSLKSHSVHQGHPNNGGPQTLSGPDPSIGNKTPSDTRPFGSFQSLHSWYATSRFLFRLPHRYPTILVIASRISHYSPYLL